MRKIRYQGLLLLIMVLFSCRTMRDSNPAYNRIVERKWSGLDENINRELPMESKNNIFEEYLWTTPPIYSQKLDFINTGSNGKATILFENKEHLFEIIDAQTMALILPNGQRILEKSRISENNIYYNINRLKTKITPIQRLVTKVRMVMKSIYVTKTRPVTKSRMVTTHNPDGSTSMRTEFYTTYETYSEYETRMVPETYTEWVTTYEESIIVPEYTYFSFKINDNKQVFVYKIVGDNNATEYYFQNPTYYSAIEKEEEFDGEYNVHLLFIDVNSNGIYFEDDDKVLFTAWNPYNKKSKYREVPNYMDNSWYRIAYLKKEKFITFTHNDTLDKIIQKDANSDYVGIKETGMVKVTNISRYAEVYINGSKYLPDLEGTLEFPIEYGIYKLHIKYFPYKDLVINFRIDESSPQFTHEYQLSKKCGTFMFQNGFLRHWVLKIVDENNNEEVHYDTGSIRLEPGKYTITISANALDIVKDIQIEEEQTEIVSFYKEIERISKEMEDKK